jgi:hypothetical protein
MHIRGSQTFQVSDREPGSRDPTIDGNTDAREKTNARHDPEDGRHSPGG